ncbi:MAG: endonuclease/exonuclease/phosphatase family protein [Pirellulaceae bacterium]|nr:endonuclease/exonuclease/phosphatase family protein [Pirellulaceae bacterium]
MRNPVNSIDVPELAPIDVARPQSTLARMQVFGKWVLRAIFVVGCLGLLAVVVACFLAPYKYHCDLITNFRAQYLGLGVGVGLIGLVLRHWRWSVVALLLTMPHALQVLPYYWPLTWMTSRLESRLADGPDATVSGTSAEGTSAARLSSSDSPRSDVLRLVSVNVLYLNQDHQKTIQFLRDTDADLIVLCECTYRWFQALKPALADTHPFNSTQLFPTLSGTRIFSRQPLRAATDLPDFRLIPDSEKVMAVSTLWQGQTIVVMGVHPDSPTSQERFKSRNNMLNLIAAVGTQVNEPLIIAGDFNCTSGSPFFLRAAGLQDSRRGFGWQGSWPTYAPEFLRIPIDHVFVNEHWQVKHREIGPSLGSDHSPVITELRLIGDSTATTVAQ